MNYWLNMYTSKRIVSRWLPRGLQQHKNTQDLRNSFIKSTRKVNIGKVLRIYLS